MDTTIMKELKIIKDRLNESERKLDNYFSSLHKESASDIADNREGIMETFEATESNAGDLADLRAAVMELYEMISE